MRMFRIVAGALIFITGSASALAQNRMVSAPAHGGNHGQHGGPNGHHNGQIATGPGDRMVINAPRHRDRDRRGHHGDFPRHGRGYTGGYWGYGGGGYVVTEVSPDMFGYFATDGESGLVNGEAVHDYDRDYPYEFGRGRTIATAAAKPRGPVRCETNLVADESGKKQVAVRVCRN